MRLYGILRLSVQRAITLDLASEEKIPGTDWKAVVRFRDTLTHGYSSCINRNPLGMHGHIKLTMLQ